METNSSNASCEYYFGRPEKRLIDDFVTSCSPFSILFNTFVLYLAFNYADFKNHLEQFFVVSMTVADLMFNLVYTSTVKVNLDVPEYFCRPWYILVWTCSMASVMFLFLLNVHKLVVLFFPIHSFMYMSQKRVLFQVAFCWSGVLLCSILFSLEPIWTLNKVECRTCVPRINPKFYSIMLTCFYVVPLVASLVISFCIFGFAQKRSNKRTPGARNDRKRMFRRIFFVFTATIWTALTFLPYRISLVRIQFCQYYSMTGDYEDKRNEQNSTPDGFADALITNITNVTNSKPYECLSETGTLIQFSLLCLLTFGAVINPLITIFTQENYRKGLNAIWKKLCQCCRTKPKDDYECIRRGESIRISDPAPAQL